MARLSELVNTIPFNATISMFFATVGKHVVVAFLCRSSMILTLSMPPCSTHAYRHCQATWFLLKSHTYNHIIVRLHHVRLEAIIPVGCTHHCGMDTRAPLSYFVLLLLDISSVNYRICILFCRFSGIKVCNL